MADETKKSQLETEGVGREGEIDNSSIKADGNSDNSISLHKDVVKQNQEAVAVKQNQEDVVVKQNQAAVVVKQNQAAGVVKQNQSAGVALIKPQFIDHDHKKKVVDRYLPKQAAAEIQHIANQRANGEDIDTANISTNDNAFNKGDAQSNSSMSLSNDAVKRNGEVLSNGGDEPPKKKAKLKGRNKKRPHDKRPDNKDKVCPAIIANRTCRFGENCKFSHDIKKFVESKPSVAGVDRCYLFDTFGKCQYGISCLYANSHTAVDDTNNSYAQIIDENKWNAVNPRVQITNTLSKEAQVKLWKKRYDFSLANRVSKIVEKTEAEEACDFGFEIKVQRPAHYKSTQSKINNPSEDKHTSDPRGESEKSDVAAPSAVKLDQIEATCDEGGVEIKLRPEEKVKVDFTDKLYLAPLTTVGNLPFRRICKQYGADITCSEMATAIGLLQGHKSEWALLKRHHTEDLFGTQVCGSRPDVLTRCAQVVMENTDVDFIDINCGCPIDLFFKKGEGCGLMNKTKKLFNIVRSMQNVINVPLTVKMRTGIFESKSTAHRLIPQLRDLGVAMVTLHGRSREQRYTRQANWNYIDQCAQEASPMPLFGNGDVLSFEDYNSHREQTGVAGCMIARGALIKPWLFKEIKEQRHWDISSGERLDMLRDFTNFGLEHWGSDLQGVQITRRFLLEWLSFLHRYIPVGVLERVPQQINEKPPYYFGRNDLETLMASANCADWIKISEMLLGPVPGDFQFLPKHKANSYQ